MNRMVNKYEATNLNQPPWYDAYVRVFGSKDLRQETNIDNIQLDNCIL